MRPPERGVSDGLIDLGDRRDLPTVARPGVHRGLLGAIAGVRVVEPPRPMLGRYLTPGDSAGILRWLRDDAPRDAHAYVGRRNREHPARRRVSVRRDHAVAPKLSA